VLTPRRPVTFFVAYLAPVIVVLFARATRSIVHGVAAGDIQMIADGALTWVVEGADSSSQKGE